MPKRRSEKAKSSFDSEKRRSEAAAFFISVKGIDRGNKAVRMGYPVKEKKSGTAGLKVFMAVLAVIMLGVVSAGGYLLYQEIQKLGPPSQPVSASAVSSQEEGESSLQVEDPDHRLLALGNSKTHLPQDLTLELREVNGVSVDSLAAPQLERMMADAEAAGVRLRLQTGRVSERILQKNYDDTVAGHMANGLSRLKAEEEALKTTLPPEQNEWCTGLLVGFANPADGDFFATDAYRWLTANGVEYGFVLRYPENKTDETGMTFQPQTFRYVGTEHAKKMRALAFCLEEYAAYVEEQKAGY